MLKKLKIQVSLKSLIFLAVFAVLLAVDLLTKFFEEKYGWNFTVIPNFIYVESGVRNSGASFSFFAGVSWGQAFLKTLTIIMIIAIIAVFLFMPERFTVLKVALAMVLAGALGNLVDRFAFNEVRDFVWVNMLGNYACCNFADFWITFGVAVIIIDMLFLNEWAVFPLTKKAKAAQKERKQAEEEQKQKSAAESGGAPSDSGVNENDG